MAAGCSLTKSVLKDKNQSVTGSVADFLKPLLLQIRPNAPWQQWSNLICAFARFLAHTECQCAQQDRSRHARILQTARLRWRSDAVNIRPGLARMSKLFQTVPAAVSVPALDIRPCRWPSPLCSCKGAGKVRILGGLRLAASERRAGLQLRNALVLIFFWSFFLATCF